MELSITEQKRADAIDLTEGKRGSGYMVSIRLEEYKALKDALCRIERWFGEFPEAVDRDGNSTSYGVAYGSNGERDYMRSIARAALALVKENDNEQ